MREIIYKCDHCKKQIQSPPLIGSIYMGGDSHREITLPTNAQVIFTIADMAIISDLPNSNRLFCNWHCLVSHSGSINGHKEAAS